MISVSTGIAIDRCPLPSAGRAVRRLPTLSRKFKAYGLPLAHLVADLVHRRVCSQARPGTRRAGPAAAAPRAIAFPGLAFGERAGHGGIVAYPVRAGLLSVVACYRRCAHVRHVGLAESAWVLWAKPKAQ